MAGAGYDAPMTAPSKTPADTPWRVAQWATGNIGTRSLRHVIQHPAMHLVGLHVYAPHKVGVDAGVLAGLDPIRVAATGTLDDILATAPDCVLYMPRQPDLGDLCRLLAAGSNVVTTVGMFHHPASMPAEARAMVERACAEGGTSIHATGSSPGFITEAVPLALLSIQRRLDLLMIDEYADMSSRNSPELMFDLMGFGAPGGGDYSGRAGHLANSFGPSMRLLADACGTPLDSVEAHGEVALATADVPIAAGLLRAGTVGAMRTVVSGMRIGRELMRFRATWYCTSALDHDWELGATGWRITVDGDAPLQVAMPFPVKPDDMAEMTPGYTANRAVNAVPFVCAAAQGILTTLDLPHLVPRL